MSDIDVFTIDDDFDPLAEIEIEAPSDEEQFNAEYIAPIPDADKSVIPAPVVLTPEERIEKLLRGLPGQEFRVLAVVQAAGTEPREAQDIIEEVDGAYPDTGSVYDVTQLMRLLEDAGALYREGSEEDYLDCDMDEDIKLTEANFIVGEDGEEYLVVARTSPARYTATPDGLAAVERHVDAGSLAAIIADEPRYKPLYARIMAMMGEKGGAATPDLDAAIDTDPLCEEPRRFCGYFIDKLEIAGLVEWRGAWVVTDLGREALATGVLDEF